jgi:hypothetical protein
MGVIVMGSYTVRVLVWVTIVRAQVPAIVTLMEVRG